MFVRLEDIRFSFLHVFQMQQPRRGDQGKPAYAAQGLFAPNHVTPGGVKVKDEANQPWRILLDAAGQPVTSTLVGVRYAIDEALRKAGKLDMKAAFGLKDKLPLHDGEQKAAQYPYYKGMLFVSARSGTRPLILDSNKAVLIEKDGKPYSGCYGTMTFDTFYYPPKNGGEGVSAQLTGVQFLRDGDAFAGGRPADLSDFDDISNTGQSPAAGVSKGGLWD